MDLQTFIHDLGQSAENYEKRYVFQQIELIQLYQQNYMQCNYKLASEDIQQLIDSNNTVFASNCPQLVQKFKQQDFQQFKELLQQLDDLNKQKEYIEVQNKDQIVFTQILQQLKDKETNWEQFLYLIQNKFISNIKDQGILQSVFHQVVQSFQNAQLGCKFQMVDFFNPNNYQQIDQFLIQLNQFLQQFSQLLQHKQFVQIFSQFFVNNQIILNVDTIKNSSSQQLSDAIDKANTQIKEIQCKEVKNQIKQSIETQLQNLIIKNYDKSDVFIEIYNEVINNKFQLLKLELIGYLQNINNYDCENSKLVPSFSNNFNTLFVIVSINQHLTSINWQLLQLNCLDIFRYYETSKQMHTYHITIEYASLCLLLSELQQYLDKFQNNDNLRENIESSAFLVEQKIESVKKQLKEAFKIDFLNKYTQLNFAQYFQYIVKNTQIINNFEILDSQQFIAEVQSSGIDIITIHVKSMEQYQLQVLDDQLKEIRQIFNKKAISQQNSKEKPKEIDKGKGLANLFIQSVKSAQHELKEQMNVILGSDTKQIDNNEQLLHIFQSVQTYMQNNNNVLIYRKLLKDNKMYQFLYIIAKMVLFKQVQQNLE